MTSRSCFFAIAAILLIPCLTFGSEMMLFYDKPAAEWVEAIPIGNGRIGAMIFGGTAEELIQFNEDTFWTKEPYNPVNSGAFDALPEARRLVFDNRAKEAQDLINTKMMAVPPKQASYQPAGLLKISFEGHDKVTDYRRELDLERAVTSVEYKIDNVNFRREIFSSAVDDVTVIHISADKSGKVNFTADFNAVQENKKINTVNNSTVSLEVNADGAVRCYSQIKAITSKGKVRIENNTLHIENADDATLFLASATNYINYNDTSGNPESIVDKQIKSASKKSYNKILAGHIKDYQRYFKRVEIDFGATEAAKQTTDLRIKNFANGNDPQLAALYFQFARYLLISCSRPGCQPANLQGLWNDSVKPPWSSKYTININTEMNYWPAEPTNLSECHEPLFALIKDISVTGEKTANVNYGANGWVCHHNTDLWRATGPIDSAFYGFWPSGGAWLCQHLWYRYEYSGDKDFLREYYPVMKGASEFFVDTLVEHPKYKWLVTCPSMSPENKLFGDTSICAGPTMDMQIIRDLFNNCIKASEILGIDADFRKVLEDKLSKLAPMQIGKHGQLQEWLEDADRPEDHHRHVSHLYGLFPSSQISKEKTPELFAAVKKSLEMRGDGGTGWSMAWKVNFWARLRDGDHSYKMLTNLISTGTYPNMFDAHPPFQIDGNFGGASGITEMLMQSYSEFNGTRLKGLIYLLPALPSALPSGSVKGLRAKGGFEVNIEWKDNKLVQADIKSLHGNALKVHYDGTEIETKTVKGKTYCFMDFKP